MNQTNGTKSQTTKSRFEDMQARQERAGYHMGYIGHELRQTKQGPKADAAVLAWLDARGFNADDIFHALNSRNGRHLADWLHGAPRKTWEDKISRSLYQTPAAMYEDFCETKEQCNAGA